MRMCHMIVYVRSHVWKVDSLIFDGLSRFFSHSIWMIGTNYFNLTERTTRIRMICKDPSVGPEFKRLHRCMAEVAGINQKDYAKIAANFSRRIMCVPGLHLGKSGCLLSASDYWRNREAGLPSYALSNSIITDSRSLFILYVFVCILI